jgi:hypothetical protein
MSRRARLLAPAAEVTAFDWTVGVQAVNAVPTPAFPVRGLGPGPGAGAAPRPSPISAPASAAQPTEKGKNIRRILT